MSDILLISVPPWAYDSPPLGIAQISTYLKSKGKKVEVLDLNIRLYHESPDIVKDLWDKKEISFWLNTEYAKRYNSIFSKLVESMFLFSSDIIGFSVSSYTSLYFARELIARVRQRRITKKIIVGGAACFFSQNRALFTGNSVDFFVIGRGEFALEYLLNEKIDNRDTPGNNPRFKIWKDDLNSDTASLQDLQECDLEETPAPTFEEFDLSSYTNNQTIPLLTSRGCIKNCIFCLDKVLSGRFKSKNTQTILSEIKYYIDRYKVNNFHFIDNLINGDLRFLENLSDSLSGEDIAIKWDAQMSVRADMNRSLFHKLKSSGCTELQFGVESFSNKVLKIMKKGFSAQEAVKNIIDAKSAGLKVTIFLIVGCPGENDNDVEETIAVIAKYSCYIDRVGNLNLLCIPPGTDLYRRLDEYSISCEGGVAFDSLRWRTKDNSNNLEIRLERYERIKVLLGKLGIPYNDNVERMWL